MRRFVFLAFMLLGGCTMLRDIAFLEVPRGEVFMLLSPKGIGGGTGFQLRTTDGYEFLVTNDHVCGLAATSGEIYVINEAGDASWTTIRYRSPNTDLCFLDPIDGAKTFQMAPSFEVQGAVRALGHPRLRRLTETAGKGLKRDLAEIGGPPDYCPAPKGHIEAGFFSDFCVMRIAAIQTSTPLEPGSSGSPALDASNQVVGVFFAVDRDGHSFMVPLEDLRAELAEAVKH